MRSAKYILSAAILLALALPLGTQAQTYVSGGIFANATWVLANSPYIITDSVVVFPNVTLTIEGGVVVKFADNTNLEIRQATLIANGTLGDSPSPITFTSNSGTPVPGIWGGIFLNGAPASGYSSFYNCNFYYATDGIYDPDYFNPPLDHATISSSTFQNNVTGISVSCMGPVSIGNCTFNNNGTGVDCYQNLGINVELSNSTFTNNSVGVNGIGINVRGCLVQSNATGLNLSYYDTITNNTVVGNGIGYANPGDPGGFYMGVNLLEYNAIEYNNVGLLLDQGGDSLYCNSIYKDTTWYLEINSSAAANVADNYWGTADSAVIQSHIFDGHNDISAGLATFTPFLGVACSGVPAVTLSVPNAASAVSFDIYPNPATDMLNISFPENYTNVGITVYNILGEKIMSSGASGQKAQISVAHLPAGTYIIEVVSNEQHNRKIFTKG